MSAFDPRRILVLMDNRGDPNWGSQATSSELVRLLQLTYPDAEIRGIPRHAAGRPKWRRSLGYRWAPYGPESEWRDPRGRLGVALLTHGWRDWIEWADLVVVNGEGTLHPQPQTLAWLPVIDWIRSRATAPVWVVNCSVMLRGEEQRTLFDRVLGNVARLVLREPESYRLAAAQGWPAEAGADCVFLADSQPPPLAKLAANGVEPPYAVLTGAASAREWDPGMAAQWPAAVRDRGWAPVFTASTRTDRLLHERAMPEVPLLTEQDLSYPELFGMIAGAEIHIGGRYHPTIFAAMAGTPFVALASNTHKMEGVMEWIGEGGVLMEPSPAETVVQAIAEAPSGRTAARERCKDLAEFSKRNAIPSPTGR